MPAVAALALVAAVSTAPVPPAPARWVEDHAAFLTPATRAALDAKLEGYERATHHQVVVWIGTTLNGAPMDDWAARTFAAWKVGRKGIDDGVVMFVLADDHAIDIEVGYGLEDRIPDAIASRIIRDVMAPRLRAGDRDGAVTAAADALIAAIEGHAWSGAAEPARERGASPVEWVFGVLAAIALLFLFIKHPRLGLLLLWSTIGRGGGGGGLGGFTGGGGRSGGGGARGKW